MSLNFAIKDILHHSGELKGYLKISISFTTITIIFINLLNTLGLLSLPQQVSIYSYTLLEFSTQYNSFLVTLTVILAAVVNLINNHTVITSRKKDISIMKAVGSVPRQLYSFYQTEVLLLTFISFLISLIIGFLANFVLYLALFSFFPGTTWDFNFVYTLLLGGAMLITTLVFNGWEIRRIGNQSFEKTQTGLVKGNLDARIKEKWLKFFNRFSRNLTLAVKNLKRKQSLLKESVFLIGLSSMILLSGVIGSLIILSTSSNYIKNSQGEKIIAVGSNSLITNFKTGYQKFNDPTVIMDSQYEYTNNQNNLTEINDAIQSLVNVHGNLEWESRLIMVETLYEQVGYDIIEIDTSGGKDYISYGEGIYNRSVPIQGINYGYTVQNWHYGGAMIDIVGGVTLGDTIAGELFEQAYQQKVSMFSPINNQEFIYNINAIAVDSFNNGNTMYISLIDLQDTLQLPNYTNLILIDYSNLERPADISSFKADLNALISAELGSDFGFIDLSSVFQQNIRALSRIFGVTLSLSIIIGIFIIFLMYEYQKLRTVEDRKDFQIIRAIGGLKNDLLKPIWIQNVITICIGCIFGLVGALYFMVLFLMEDAVYPSIIIPLIIFIGMIALFVGLSAWSSSLLTKKYIDKPFEEMSL